MAKKNETLSWSELLTKGKTLIDKGCGYADEATKTLMKEKGFKNWYLFDASVVGGGETVIRFNDEGEFANLDIHYAAEMSKEQIIKTLSRYVDEEKTLELLKQ